MLLGKRWSASTMFRVGLVSLTLGGFWRLFVHPTAWLTASAVDAVAGFLYGISIGALLLGIVKDRRRGASQ